MSPELSYNPPHFPYLPIVFHDDQILVISKPAELLSVPGKDPALWDCVEWRARQIVPKARIIHRLDMATSGVMVLALTRSAHVHLSRQFEQRQVAKTYIAKVWGVIKGDSGQIDMPMICDWPNRPLQKICYDQGRQAITNWNVLKRFEDSTLVELKPLTGRSHQLRLHMKEIGHPILGDRFYGTQKTNVIPSDLSSEAVAKEEAEGSIQENRNQRFLHSLTVGRNDSSGIRVMDLSPRLMLHAQEIEFIHPVNGDGLKKTDFAPFPF